MEAKCLFFFFLPTSMNIRFAIKSKMNRFVTHKGYFSIIANKSILSIAIYYIYVMSRCSNEAFIYFAGFYPAKLVRSKRGTEFSPK